MYLARTQLSAGILEAFKEEKTNELFADRVPGSDWTYHPKTLTLAVRFYSSSSGRFLDRSCGNVAVVNSAQLMAITGVMVDELGFATRDEIAHAQEKFPHLF